MGKGTRGGNRRGSLTRRSTVAFTALLLWAAARVVVDEMARNGLAAEAVLTACNVALLGLLAVFLIATVQTIRGIAGAARAGLNETAAEPARPTRDRLRALYALPPRGAETVEAICEVARGELQWLDTKCAACALPLVSEGAIGRCPGCGRHYHTRCWYDRKGVCVGEDCLKAREAVETAVPADDLKPGEYCARCGLPMPGGAGPLVSDGYRVAQMVRCPTCKRAYHGRCWEALGCECAAPECRKEPPSSASPDPVTSTAPTFGGAITPRAYVFPRCPRCGNEIVSDAERITCPGCQTYHHVRCWAQNGGCAKEGCSYAPAREA